MKIKEQIANFFTLLNLASGVMAIICILKLQLTNACLFVFLGAVFDFLDGFVARALGIASELGKQLDSLSDVVTFGVVPGVIAFCLLATSLSEDPYKGIFPFANNPPPPLCYIVLLIPVFSAYRLAKFNIDTRQSKNFIGLPTPANGLLWASFGLILTNNAFSPLGDIAFTGIGNTIRQLLASTAFLVPTVVVMSLILVSPLNLMGLKFDKFSWQGNEVKFSLVAVSLILLILLGFTAVPIILLLYIIFSIIHFYVLKQDLNNR